MDEGLERLAAEIRRANERLRSKAAEARRSKGLASKVGKARLSLSVCAVDGGLLAHRMHGSDIVVARAAAACFTYADARLSSHDYHPSKSPRPSVDMRGSLDEHEAAVFRTLVRLRHELSCAIESLSRFSPDMLLLDGSLLPLPSDRPPEGSELGPLHKDALSAYERLFQLCKEKDCMLCGVVKDSRARKLANTLGMRCADSALCSHLLEEGERTVAMPYSDDGPGKQISVFYLKASESDLPLRIELLGDKVEEAASIILSLSAISENYAYPAVLIEADMRAALDPREIETIESSLRSLTGIRPLRRNLRPFR